MLNCLSAKQMSPSCICCFSVVNQCLYCPNRLLLCLEFYVLCRISTSQPLFSKFGNQYRHISITHRKSLLMNKSQHVMIDLLNWNLMFNLDYTSLNTRSTDIPDMYRHTGHVPTYRTCSYIENNNNNMHSCLFMKDLQTA